MRPMGPGNGSSTKACSSRLEQVAMLLKRWKDHSGKWLTGHHVFGGLSSTAVMPPRDASMTGDMIAAPDQSLHHLPDRPIRSTMLASQEPGQTIRRASADTATVKELAERWGLTWREDLHDVTAASEFVEKVPINFARRHSVLVYSVTTDCPWAMSWHVAIGDPRSFPVVETLSRYLGHELSPVLVPATAILSAIHGAYQQRTGLAQAMIQQLEPPDILLQAQMLANREDLLDVASRAPVIKLVNLILFEAIRMNASDVHIQPYEQKLVVRLRIDGVLFDAYELPKAMQEEILSRLKVMGRMNIAEKRLPQDGRATVQVGDRLIDLRLAAQPTSSGERLVVRLLDKSARLYTLPELGMGSQTLERFRQLIHIDHGLILVTGPTGSGKSTTLYAALQEINSQESNILTLEDPIEYQLPGVSQTQVSEKKGLTFAKGLRSVLRQDPDIIMVGEIRDRETAVMAIQSSLTGHLVFSTLHTNDAASAITRLADLGVEPYLIASSLVGVLAQRLVRQVCGQCGQAQPLSVEECQRLDMSHQISGDAPTVRRGSGCDHCRQTGYRGRVGIFELLQVDDSIRKLIQTSATAAQIKSSAIQTGMQTLRDDGLAKALDGLTTPEEVLRVTVRASH